ncbi:MAG: usg protein [Alphaproteobacteria bacterium]|nr:usg protein [Alphaproteobacteria bacterium]
MNDFSIQLEGYRLTTAQILYHLPDHPDLLQEFIWQHYDLAPKFPKLHKFLNFWERKIEGSLHSVYVAEKKLIGPAKTKLYDAEFTLQ